MSSEDKRLRCAQCGCEVLITHQAGLICSRCGQQVLVQDPNHPAGPSSKVPQHELPQRPARTG